MLNIIEIFKEIEEKRSKQGLGINTLKEKQITFIFDTLEKFIKKFRRGDFFSCNMTELKFIGEIFEQCIDVLTDIDGTYT
ncbi:23_t:CDS:2, partial [Racocetra persica]